jgi:hypothetical protein
MKNSEKIISSFFEMKESNKTFLLECVEALRKESDIASFLCDVREKALLKDNKAFTNLSRYLKAAYILKDRDGVDSLIKGNPVNKLLKLSSLKPFIFVRDGKGYNIAFTVLNKNLDIKAVLNGSNVKKTNNKKLVLEKILDALKESIKDAVPTISDEKLEKIEKEFIKKVKIS